MDPRRLEQICASFDEIVTLDEDERIARLSALAAHDPDLHAAVELLLKGDAAADARLACLDFCLVSAASKAAPAASVASASRDPFGLSGRLVSHFRVLEPIGSGGMGVVYRAEDTHLGREIALKFPLPQHGADDSSKERFLIEARSAASLDHPNLCTIYEVGDSDEGPFMALALYRGETLKARLARVGRLAIPETLDIARQVAEGLAYAHASGIVHRDLKPGNLMLLADGTVKVLDFGLAKAREDNARPSGSRVGTLSYMAPEQIRGEPVDFQADLWALGVVLYEMLAGFRPFQGQNELAMARAIVHDQPVSLSSIRADLPPGLDDVVLALLAKDPSKRTPNAKQLLGDLVSTGTATARRPARGSTVAFARVFAGIVALVITGAVAAEWWMRARDGATHDPRDATSSAHVVTSEAYRHYLVGNFHLAKYTEAEFRQALDHYRQAIDLDPSYAPAYAGEAVAYIELGSWASSLPPTAVHASAKAASLAALDRDSMLAEAHIALGRVKQLFEWDWAGAEAEYRRGIALNPTATYALLVYVNYLTSVGRFAEAVRIARRAIELDPLQAFGYESLGFVLEHMDRDAEALEQYQKALDVSPNDASAIMEMAEIHARGGRFDKASQYSLTADSLLGGSASPTWRCRLGYEYAVAGRRADALRVLNELKARGTREYVPPAALAVIYVALGQNDQALDLLEQAYRQRDVTMAWLKVRHQFDPIRGDTRFQDLLRRMKFPT